VRITYYFWTCYWVVVSCGHLFYVFSSIQFIDWSWLSNTKLVHSNVTWQSWLQDAPNYVINQNLSLSKKDRAQWCTQSCHLSCCLLQINWCRSTVITVAVTGICIQRSKLTKPVYLIDVTWCINRNKRGIWLKLCDLVSFEHWMQLCVAVWTAYVHTSWESCSLTTRETILRSSLWHN